MYVWILPSAIAHKLTAVLIYAIGLFFSLIVPFLLKSSIGWHQSSNILLIMLLQSCDIHFELTQLRDWKTFNAFKQWKKRYS